MIAAACNCATPMAADGTPMHGRRCPRFTGKLRDGWSPMMSAIGQKWRVLTADGQYRTATVTADADTFWTLPARVTVHGRTVTGHIYANTLADVGEWRFSPYAYRRNAAVLPTWPAA